jgi:hypothetical protein
MSIARPLRYPPPSMPTGSPSSTTPRIRAGLHPAALRTIGIATLATALVGCAKPIANSPALNRTVEGESETEYLWATTMLDAEQRREVEGVIRTLPGDRTAEEVGPGPTTAPRGRWSDLPNAARRAASKAEVAILSTRFEPDGASLDSADRIVFSIVTLTSEPGRLEVSRGTDGSVYRASATIGLLGERTETADRLVAELAREVEAFGRKPELAPILD